MTQHAPLAAIVQQKIRAFADYWAEKAENARFAAQLRGPSDDEPEEPYVRVFACDIDALVANLRELESALAAPSPEVAEEPCSECGCEVRVTDGTLQCECPAPLPWWRCFHCGAVVRGHDSGREYFGPTRDDVPLCRVEAHPAFQAIQRRAQIAEAKVAHPAAYGLSISDAAPPEGWQPTENRLRAYLWLSHGHVGQYGDDGEMQCGQCAPFGVWDYKREQLAKLLDTIDAVDTDRLRRALVPVPSPPAGERMTKEEKD